MKLNLMLQEYPVPTLRIKFSDAKAIESITHHILQKLKNYEHNTDILLLCIGTDRSTGDSLGPLVGSIFKKFRSPFVHVYGTLDEPVHAINLQDTIDRIHLDHKNPTIIAIDACLGRLTSVGHITVTHGPLKPGSGVHKDLPEIGDFHITGIVNVAGFMEYFVLQNTRLSIVMKMAESIAYALHKATRQHEQQIFKTAANTSTCF